MPRTLHTAALAMSEDGKAPLAFRIFPKGKFNTTKGDFLFDGESAKQCLSSWEDYGNDLMVDYDHRAISKDGPPENSKAAGWFKPEVRDGELWAGDVTWTPAASAAIEAKEWRYVSGYFAFEPKTGRIVELLNVALTNMPATKNQEPLVDLCRDARTSRAALAMSLEDVAGKLEEAVGKFFGWAAWPTEIFDTYCILRANRRYFSLDYSVNGREVELGAEAVEVEREYVPVKNGERLIPSAAATQGRPGLRSPAEQMSAALMRLRAS